MFARSYSKNLLLALSLTMFVSASSAQEATSGQVESFPMIMWQRDSKVPTQEIDDTLTA
jgi:hypothetical protein